MPAVLLQHAWYECVSVESFLKDRCGMGRCYLDTAFQPRTKLAHGHSSDNLLSTISGEQNSILFDVVESKKPRFFLIKTDSNNFVLDCLSGSFGWPPLLWYWYWWRQNSRLPIWRYVLLQLVRRESFIFSGKYSISKGDKAEIQSLILII